MVGEINAFNSGTNVLATSAQEKRASSVATGY